MIYDTKFQILSESLVVAIKQKALLRGHYCTWNSTNLWSQKIAYSSEKYYSSKFQDRFDLRISHAAMFVLSGTWN
jgi:hypothetical protein